MGAKRHSAAAISVDDAPAIAEKGFGSGAVRHHDCGSIGAWHVASTDYQAEQAVAREIRALPGAHFQALVPMVRVRVPQGDRPAIRRAVVAFPGYALVWWGRAAPWESVLRLRQVTGLLHAVGAADRPAEVDPAFMRALLGALSPQGVLEDERSAPMADPRLVPGAAVRVRLAGQSLDGVLDWATERRVSVLLGAMGRVTVPRAAAEPVA